ncbi:uncharacterized protein CLUP02_03708, partial [Colletotrichum lupini]
RYSPVVTALPKSDPYIRVIPLPNSRETTPLLRAPNGGAETAPQILPSRRKTGEPISPDFHTPLPPFPTQKMTSNPTTLHHTTSPSRN